jgi:membrane protein
MLLNMLTPLGEKGAEITHQIIGFVENMKAGVLGSIGLAFLIYTVISLLQKIERSFNYAWHVTEPRTFAQRFSDYLSVIMVGPVLMFSAIGLTASIMNTAVMQQISTIQPMGELIHLVTRLVPYFLIILAFTFIYVFVPNTKVKIRSAFVGALVAGILWETVGFLFASFVVSSAKYTAVYSALATLILFMIWLYIGWLILLTGASIAFYHQHPEYLLSRSRNIFLSNRSREKLAMQIMYLVAENFYTRKDPWATSDLANFLNVPMEIMLPLINTLEDNHMLVRAGKELSTYLPAKPLDQITLKDILRAIDLSDNIPFFRRARTESALVIDSVFDDVDGAISTALENRTLRMLVEDNVPSAEENPSEE